MPIIYIIRKYYSNFTIFPYYYICYHSLLCGVQNDALQNNPIKSWGTENKHWNLFVARFFECPFCFEDNNKREDEIALCHDSYLEHYEFAFCRFHRCAPPPLAPPLVLQPAPCGCAAAPGCPGKKRSCMVAVDVQS